VSGNAEAGTLLESLYRRRLFVDRGGTAYQRHDLFPAFLQQEFGQAYTAEVRIALQLRPAEELRTAGRSDDGSPLACGAQNWDAACALAFRYAGDLFEQGRGTALRQWLAALPAERVDADPWLGFWLAVATSAVSPAQARERFAHTYAKFE